MEFDFESERKQIIYDLIDQGYNEKKLDILNF